MVFKKDITPMPIGRGDVVKHRGKGAAERRPDVMAQITNRYPKPAPQPVPSPAPTPAPAGIGPFRPPSGV
jgi:hypothetical protein